MAGARFCRGRWRPPGRHFSLKIAPAMLVPELPSPNVAREQEFDAETVICMLLTAKERGEWVVPGGELVRRMLGITPFDVGLMSLMSGISIARPKIKSSEMHVKIKILFWIRKIWLC